MNLKEILKKHEMYLRGEEGGERADLSGLELSGLDFSNSDLSKANFSGVILSKANFHGSKLLGANFSYADLSYSDLSYVDLSKADFSKADLAWANLSGAKLEGVITYCCDLSGAYIRGADFSGVVSIHGFMGLYYVSCVKNEISIGCQTHTSAEWSQFTDEEIRRMSPNALMYWKAYKQAILELASLITTEA